MTRDSQGQVIINGIPLFRCKICGGPCWQRHGAITGQIMDDAPFLHTRDEDWKNVSNPHNAEPGEPWTREMYATGR